MISHVVDASMFGPLFFDDEKDDLFDDLADLIANNHCVVPQHWRLEVTNQILSGLRRKRMTNPMAEQAVAQIDEFPIETDPETGLRYARSFELAQKHGLTVYDAAYLELAMRRQLFLVTYDTALRDAARTEDIAILPL